MTNDNITETTTCFRGKDLRVRSDGVVYSDYGRPRKPTKGRDGYLKLFINRNSGKNLTVELHAVVAHAFLGKRPDGLTVNHIDGNKLNNDVSNLEYVSVTVNNQKREHTKKRMPKSSKLPIDVVRLIRNDSSFSNKAWGDIIGRSRYVPRDIRLGKTYRYVK